LVDRHNQRELRATRRSLRLAAASVVGGIALTTVVLAVTAERSASHAGDGTLSDVQTAASLKMKLAVEHQLGAAQEAARKLLPPPKDPKRGVAVVPSPGPWPSGIFESPQAPFTPALYRISNQWQGRIGDEFVQVFAGAKTADPSQGVVVVLTTSAIDLSNRTPQTGGFYLTPEKLGALRIVSADGTHLTLATPSGKRFAFDVISRVLLAQ